MTSNSWVSVMLAVPGRLKEAAVVKKDNFKKGIRSKENFKEYIRTPGSRNDPSESRWSWCNEDLLPTPPEKRSWGYWNYFCLYFSWSMDNWTLGSTMIGIGLNWWQSILVVFAGQLIASVFKAINSRCGAVYHIGYPIVSRSVFGMYGAYYVVFARAMVALVYYAIKVYIGSSFVVNMLTAVFGSHFTNIPNHISESTGFTTQQMLAFFLFWLIHIPFTLLRPNQISWVFTVKMCTIPPAYIGLFIFCMVNTKGQMGAALPGSKTVTSSQFSWFVMYAINAAIGNGGASITNAPDYARWSRTHWAVIWPNLIANPLSVTISATFGILATSAINNVWGLELWNQWDLLSEIMIRYPRPDVRFAVFLCAAAQALLVLGTNIAANMIPFGLDCTMLVPRYINIIRGQVLALFLVWAANPWKIVNSAATFTKFLSGYNLFMAAIVGPTTVEYYILTKGNIWIPELYSGERSINHHYWYTGGWNISAYIAYFAGITIPFAGFLGTLGVKVSDTAADLGHLGWLLSYFVSATIYFVCCKIWPTPAQRAVKTEALGWEELASVYSEFSATETLDSSSQDIESEGGETVQGGMKAAKASSIVDIVTLRT